MEVSSNHLVMDDAVWLFDIRQGVDARLLS